MVRVDVHVQHAAEAVEEAVDGDHNVVHEAEPAGAAVARVVHAAGPVDGDVVLAAGQGARRRQRAAGVAQAVVPEVVDDRVVVGDAAAGFAFVLATGPILCLLALSWTFSSRS